MAFMSSMNSRCAGGWKRRFNLDAMRYSRNEMGSSWGAFIEREKCRAGVRSARASVAIGTRVVRWCCGQRGGWHGAAPRCRTDSTQAARTTACICAAFLGSESLPFGSFTAVRPQARLVGSTAPTRTAFRVLWRSIRAAISVSVLWLPPLSGLIERECQDASIKPLTWGNGPLLTKIGVFPLGCPDTLVWGARAAKSPGTV